MTAAPADTSRAVQDIISATATHFEVAESELLQSVNGKGHAGEAKRVAAFIIRKRLRIRQADLAAMLHARRTSVARMLVAVQRDSDRYALHIYEIEFELGQAARLNRQAIG